MEESCCKNCIFWREINGAVGNCNRFPPTVVPCNEESSFERSPMTPHDHLCGEHKPNGWIYGGK